MSEENTPPTPPPAMNLLPPDFFLPKADGNPARLRPGNPKIYLSWGDEVYGPTTVEEVMAGLRSSFYEPATVFWFEGRESWSPLAEFVALADEIGNWPDVPRPTGVRQESNPKPLSADREQTQATRKKAGSAHHGKLRKARRSGYRGYWVVFAFVLLAVALTVGILVLMADLT